MDERSLVDEALGGVAAEGLDPLQAREVLALLIQPRVA